MCGRFASYSPPDELAAYFGAEPPERLLEPSYNVAPTDEVYAVVARDGHRRMGTLRWGLVPAWADDPKVGSRMINARAETVAARPAFRRAFERRRCLLPADGFYEWQRVPGRRARQPWFVHRADGEPLALAGLWERWADPAVDGAEPMFTCCVITTPANADMAPVHDRMPAVLAPGEWDRWLNPGEDDLAGLAALLRPAPDGLLAFRPVSSAVNNVRNQGPELVARCQE
jgi:putative SOS response-associated peptidase YedK